MSNEVKNPNFIERTVAWADEFQRRHTVISLPYAIIKKQSDDQGGHLAALITYYGFLSLFPLLIVATAVIQTIAQRNDEIREQLLQSITSYFPAIGDSLADSIQTPSRAGLALFIGLVITFYGSKGIADAVQNTLHVVWAVPRRKRAGFPKNALRSYVMIIFAGTGLIVAAALSGYATGSDFPFLVRIAFGTLGFITLFSVFWGVYTFGSSAPTRPIANVPGALIAATGLLVLQAMGSYLVTEQLSRQTGLNAQFGVVLVLLFWIYLQAKIFVFGVEYNTVRAHRLYPRSLDDSNPTEADKKAYILYATRDNHARPPKV